MLIIFMTIIMILSSVITIIIIMNIHPVLKLCNMNSLAPISIAEVKK